MAKKPFKARSTRGSIESRFDEIQQALARRFSLVQQDLTEKTLKLSPPDLMTLSAFLVELGEDLHCGIGFATSLEQWHQEFFATPLPFVVEPGSTLPPDQIVPERIQHFLWV